MNETSQDPVWEEAKRIKAALTDLQVDMWNLHNMCEDESLRAEFAEVTFQLKETRDSLETMIEAKEGTANWLKPRGGGSFETDYSLTFTVIEEDQPNG